MAIKFTKKELEYIESVFAKIYGTGDHSDADAEIVKSIYNKLSKGGTSQ